MREPRRGCRQPQERHAGGGRRGTGRDHAEETDFGPTSEAGPVEVGNHPDAVSRGAKARAAHRGGNAAGAGLASHGIGGDVEEVVSGRRRHQGEDLEGPPEAAATLRQARPRREPRRPSERQFLVAMGCGSEVAT